MSEEIKETLDDVKRYLDYVEATKQSSIRDNEMKTMYEYITSLQQKVEQLETIINEAKEECKAVIEDSEHTTVSEFNINGLMITILNILKKGDNKE